MLHKEFIDHTVLTSDDKNEKPKYYQMCMPSQFILGLKVTHVTQTKFRITHIVIP